MTLSRWLRDYLYISLGGNRKGELRTCVNLFLTMFLGGLWHGRSWTFVCGVPSRARGWCWSGCGSCAAKPPGSGRSDRRGRIVGWLVTFNVVCLAWVFFRAPNMDVAFDVLGQIATGWGTPSELVTPLLLAVIVLMLASQWVPQPRS